MSDKKVYFFIENNKYNEIPDEELIALIRKGDTKAQNYLLEKYKALVGMKANKFFLIGAEDDDIVQEGMIGLFKAIQSFDLEKNNLLNDKFEYEKFFVSSAPENFKIASQLFYKLDRLPDLVTL